MRTPWGFWDPDYRALDGCSCVLICGAAHRVRAWAVVFARYV